MTSTQKAPVADWATDFDHTDPTWAADPSRSGTSCGERCPVAHSDRYGGVWLPTRHEDVAAIAHDTEHFTSEGVIVSRRSSPRACAAGLRPAHLVGPAVPPDARRLLLPGLLAEGRSPGSSTSPAPPVASCSTSCWRAATTSSTPPPDYAQHIPVRVIAEMLGFPPRTATSSAAFIHRDRLGGPPGRRRHRGLRPRTPSTHYLHGA